MPPEGTQRTALQLGQTTTVWECENTVVLQRRGVGREEGVREGRRRRAEARGGRVIGHRAARGGVTHIVKHPWHLTSMK